MRLTPPLLVVLTLGCGAATPLYEPTPVADVPSTTDIADVLTIVDVVPAPDVVVPFDKVVTVDSGPVCDEGVACNEGIAACELGRMRCDLGAPRCRAVGAQPPGTVCPGGTCDGRGVCRPPAQPSCPMPSETGCGLVFMTGGTFTLGDTAAYRATPLQNMVTVNAFALDAYEVTVDRFRRFWNAGRPAPTRPIAYPSGSLRWEGAVNEPITPGERCNWIQPSAGAHPINCVDWWTAQAFCVWDGARLPTEAEWEFAARQQPGAGLTANRRYPWGNTPPAARCDRAHWNGCPGDDGARTRRVGSFAPSAGFFDLAGNVWEWTGDLFMPYTDSTCWGGVARENPRCAASATGFPTVRGGSWVSASNTLLAGASRDDAYRPTTRSSLVGFRCARSR